MPLKKGKREAAAQRRPAKSARKMFSSRYGVCSPVTAHDTLFARRITLSTEVIMNAEPLSFFAVFQQADAAVQLAVASLLFSLLFSLWGLLRLKLRKRKGC